MGSVLNNYEFKNLIALIQNPTLMPAIIRRMKSLIENESTVDVEDMTNFTLDQLNLLKSEIQEFGVKESFIKNWFRKRFH